MCKQRYPIFKKLSAESKLSSKFYEEQDRVSVEKVIRREMKSSRNQNERLNVILISIKYVSYFNSRGFSREEKLRIVQRYFHFFKETPEEAFKYSEDIAEKKGLSLFIDFFKSAYKKLMETAMLGSSKLEECLRGLISTVYNMKSLFFILNLSIEEEENAQNSEFFKVLLESPLSNSLKWDYYWVYKFARPSVEYMVCSEKMNCFESTIKFQIVNIHFLEKLLKMSQSEQEKSIIILKFYTTFHLIAIFLCNDDIGFDININVVLSFLKPHATLK